MPFIRHDIWKNFLPFCGLSFNFFGSILWSTELFHFDDAQFIYLFFCCLCLRCLMSQGSSRTDSLSCLWQAEQWLPKMLTSQSPESVNVTLYSRRDFVDVIKSRVLQWGIILDYLDGYDIITVIFVKQRQDISGTKGDVTMKNLEQSKTVEWCQEGAMNQGMPEASRSPWRQGNRLFAEASRRNTALLTS